MKIKHLLNVAGGILISAFGHTAYAQTYCIPTPSSNCNLDDRISNVTFAGINNNSGCTSGYGNYTSGTPANISSGISYPISVTVGPGGNEAIAAWIDYNQDGVFETSEYTYIGNVTGGTANATINVPANAAPGSTRMRVRSFYVASGTPSTIYETTANSSCASISTNFGETEDYTVIIAAGTNCAGVPATLTITSSETSVCASTVLMLNSDNTAEGGLSYQWQSSINGGTTWTDLGAAQTTSMYNATGQSVTTQYRLILTCSNGGATITSNVITITQNAITACLCEPVLDCTDDDMITNVTFGAINNNSSCGTDGYSNYTATTPAVIEASQDYPISVTVGDGWTNESVSVWIDYNQNGIFEAAEFTYIGTGSGSVVSGTISVPPTATSGNTTMRVRVAAVGSVAATDDMACDEEQGYGETEDYTVTISGAVAAIDSVVVNTLGNIPAVISTPTGTIQVEATVYPLTANQDVTWSVINVTGTATISSTGLVTAQTAGTVWAKAVSDENITKADSILITINPLGSTIDSVVVTTLGNVPAVISTPTGTLQVEATVYPLTANQDVTWSIINVTGTATVSSTGLVTAQTAGTVWAKAVSDENATKADSILITINPLVSVIDSVVVTTLGNVPSVISTPMGTLQTVATVYPLTANQNVTWSIINVTGTATISSTGLVTAQTNGNVWAKAVSVENTAKMDSVLIVITNQNLGLSDLFNNTELSVFPNPTSDAVKLQSTSKHGVLSIRLTDAAGNLVSVSAVQENELNTGVTINMENVAPGMYFITLEGAGTLVTKSIVRK